MKTLELDVVFGGSSTKLTGHVGAASHLASRPDVRVVRVAGASGGALTAALWATVGIEEAQKILMSMPYEKFFSYGITSLSRFVAFGYATSGRAYYKALKKVFGEKTFEDTTLDIHVIVSNMSLRKAEVWSRETTPKTLLRDAVYISTCIPGVFKPLPVGEQLYLDGSLYWDFPINLWRDWPRPRMGFKFQSESYPSTDDKLNGLQMLRMTLDGAVDANGDQSMRDVREEPKAFIVPMETGGVTALDFALEASVKEALHTMGSGLAAKALDRVLKLADVNDWWAANG